VIARGEGGGGAALAMACDSLERGHATMVILGGIHSDMDRAVIDRLVAQRRLITNENVDALTPGEMAAFVAICSTRHLARLGIPPLAAIGACATATEPAHYDNDLPMALARGLTHAMHQASAALVAAKLRAGWMISDVTHETWRLLEYQSVSVRAKDVFGEPCIIDTPAHRLGSLGAAAVPFFVLHAAEAWRAGFAPHPLALAFAGSDTGERTAVLMTQA
jgi:3-oxoacyl-[acyl-carrier-protein] synthase-1